MYFRLCRPGNFIFPENRKGNMDLAVTHKEIERQFVVVVDGKECVVEYELEKEPFPAMNVYRTFVHPDLRGRGIAEMLMKSVAAYALETRTKIRPTCSYAVSFFKRRSYSELVAEDVDPENKGSCRLPNR
jgi:predicted GNAT family acetyltransferase